MDKLDLGAIGKAVREEFDRKVAATGLETYPIRGGVSITGWGNEGRDIEAELKKAGLPCERTLSGAFIVSSWPMEQEAFKAAFAEREQTPTLSPAL